MAHEQTYSDAEIAERLRALPGWSHDAGWLTRAYETDGWPSTLQLVNLLGYYAEAANHHPDLSVSWARVAVRLQTHSAGGITDKDFELARRYDEAALWRPRSGALDGPSGEWIRPGESP